MAGIYKIFGHHYWIVWLIQAMLHAGTALLVLKIAEEVFFNSEHRRKIAILAMSIYGFYPDLVQSTAFLLTEILYLFFIVLAIYFAIKIFRATFYSNDIFFALSTGLASLVRPVALGFASFALLGYLIFKKRWKTIIITMLSLFIIIAPFSLYFIRESGHFVVLSDAGGYDLWLGNNKWANGEIIPIPESEGLFKGSEAEVNDQAIREVKKFISEYPLLWARLQIIKASKYFSLIRPYGFWFYLSKIEQLIIVIPSLVFLWLSMIGGIAGMAMAIKNLRDPIHKFVALLAAAAPLSVIPILVEPRYRFQLYPFLAIYAAYFLIKTWDWKFLSRIEKKIIAIVSIILIINAGIDIMREKDLILSKINFYQSGEIQETINSPK